MRNRKWNMGLTCFTPCCCPTLLSTVPLLATSLVLMCPLLLSLEDFLSYLLYLYQIIFIFQSYILWRGSSESYNERNFSIYFLPENLIVCVLCPIYITVCFSPHIINPTLKHKHNQGVGFPHYVRSVGLYLYYDVGKYKRFQ